MSTSLIDKIEKLIKREKTTPEKKRCKDEPNKSSSEILSELFGAFNADPPKIDEASLKKSKKNKKKHKKEKKKRSRSSSSSSNSDSDYSHKRKKRKKSKSKKRKDKERDKSPSLSRSRTPDLKPDLELLKNIVKKEEFAIKEEKERIKHEPKEERKRRVSIKQEDDSKTSIHNIIDTSDIPMPDSEDMKLDSSDLRFKLDNKKSEAPVSDNDKTKGKIQIKNLKFSAVFEETVKQAEEEARKKAKMYEEGEYTDSSSDSEKVHDTNSQFPKTSDPGGILKKLVVEDDTKLHDEDKSHSKKSKHDKEKHADSSHKSRRDRSRSRKRSKSRSRRSRSRSPSKKYHSSSKSYRRSRSRHRSRSRSRRRSTSRSRRKYDVRRESRRRTRSRSPTGVKLADHEKKRLLEVARRNAINMLKNGAVPAGAAALPPHTRSQVMAAIQSGGKSVDELTDFCKHLSKKEALGELSSVSSGDEGISENEDTIAFHHPFLVKEKAPIVMNIRGGAPLPVKSAIVPIANKEELRIQFPVSSGSQHRDKAIEWVPVEPKKTDTQIAKLNSKPEKTTEPKKSAPLALPAPLPPPPPVPAPLAPLALPAPPEPETPAYTKGFTSGSQLTTVPAALPALPAPGPQAYPPGLEPPKIDYASIVSQKIAMIRKEQEQNELYTPRGFGFGPDKSLGQFTGSTGAQILTPRELASGTQAWAKKDQLQRAAPVEGGMGMTLLQKMGWTPGQGLGKEGTGTLQPLLLEVKLDTKGLQAKEEAVGRGKGAGVRGQRPGRRGPAPLVAGGKHPVSLLGEYCSKQKLGPPEYNLCFECGPDHKKNFLFKVKVAGVEYQPAVASANKKQAKADAAQLALQKLGIAVT